LNKCGRTLRIQEYDPDPFHTLPYIVGSTTTAGLPFHHAIVDELPDGLEAIIAAGDLQGVEPMAGRFGAARLLGVFLAAQLDVLRRRGELPSRPNTAILLTGDLQPRADSADVRGVWLSLADECRWIAGVAGNHDAFGPDQRGEHVSAVFDRAEMQLLDNRVITIGTMKIGGLSGIVGNSAEPWVRAESEFAAAMGRLAGLGPDILLSHDGPNIAGTGLTGWPSVRKALEAAPPTILFRGHDSWKNPLATLANGTQVLNVEGRVVVLRTRGN
jgi:hypothetical protein